MRPLPPGFGDTTNDPYEQSFRLWWVEHLNGQIHAEEAN